MPVFLIGFQEVFMASTLKSVIECFVKAFQRSHGISR